MLKKLFSVSLSAALLLSIALGAFAATDLSDKQTISVNSNAKLTVAPDIAYVSLGFSTNGKDIGTANKAAVARTKKVVAALKKVGIKDAEIKTNSIYVNPVQDYMAYSAPIVSPEKASASVSKAVQTEQNYSASVSLSVTINDVKTASEVIDAGMKAGATSIGDIQYDVKDASTAYDLAIKSAIDKAKAQAKSIADASGLKLGKIISINDNGYYSSGYYGGSMGYSMYGQTAAVQPAIPTDGLGGAIKQGEVTINASINMVYEAK